MAEYFSFLSISYVCVFHHINIDIVALFVLFLLICCVSIYFHTKKPTIYMLDFACFKGSEEFKVSHELFMNLAKSSGYFDENSLDFQQKILDISGIGDESYAPRALLATPPYQSLEENRNETEMIIFDTIDNLFNNTKIKPSDIGGLVVNCSGFCPIPSLADMIINHYKMKDTILSYHLSGMGCSAGVISLSIAKNLLEKRLQNSYVMVVSTEILTPFVYIGKNASMLIPNCLFRVGGAAILLTNKKTHKAHAKYRMSYIVGANNASDDMSYEGNFMQEDEDGNLGLMISKHAMEATSQAVMTNIKALSRSFLPLYEKVRYAACKYFNFMFGVKMAKPYLPRFSLAFEHLCMHVGARAALDEMQRSLGLCDKDMEASKMTLHRFGNTSSSSLWYELGYLEAKRRVKEGDRVWLLSFGAGMLSHSAILVATRSIDEPSDHNPWNHEDINDASVGKVQRGHDTTWDLRTLLHSGA